MTACAFLFSDLINTTVENLENIKAEKVTNNSVQSW